MRKKKENFRKMSVRPFAKLMYTATLERIKIIACGFFCLKGAYPIARRLTKIKQNEIFNGFAISREPIDEIDSNFFYFKGMD